MLYNFYIIFKLYNLLCYKSYYKSDYIKLEKNLQEFIKPNKKNVRISKMLGFFVRFFFTPFIESFYYYSYFYYGNN